MQTDAKHWPEDPRLDRLIRILRQYPSSITAWSGGVDSTLVAVVAAHVHGSRALAVTGISPSLAASEEKAVRELGQRFGLRHRCLETHEYRRPQYRANLGDRCYHCKSELFDRLCALAQAEAFDVVYSGDNHDDLSDIRPGLKAAKERDVQAPLLEAGLGKSDIRELARLLQLPNHDKPAAPCLASRIPTGTPVEIEDLRQVDRAEAAVRRLGFRVFRVRHHGQLARLELAANEMDRGFEQRRELVEVIRAAGYRWVALELAPFRSGSLHVLSNEKLSDMPDVPAMRGEA